MLKRKAKIAVAEQEDAWLNDNQAPLDLQYVASHSTVFLSEKQSTAFSHGIRPGNPLWPIMLRLSSYIYRELYQKSEDVPERTPVMTEMVRGQAISLLRSEPLFSRQVHDCTDVEMLLAAIVNEVLGYGPLEVLLHDETVQEIMVVGPHLVYVRRNGKVQKTDCPFGDDQHLKRLINTMVRRAGVRIDPHAPMVDLRLPDGTQVTAVMPPNAVKGPTLTIRTPWRQDLSLNNLIERGLLTQEMADFLISCVKARLNIVISGDLGAGRTTLLNALASCISEDKRIVTLEDCARLTLPQLQIISLEAPATSLEKGQPGLTMGDLVNTARRLRPDHLVLDECHGAEAFDLLQTMQNGHNGLLFTLYAQHATDVVTRLEALCALHKSCIHPEIVHSQFIGSLDLIIHIGQLPNHSYKIHSVVDVQGTEDSADQLQNIYYFSPAQSGEVDQQHMDGDFKVSGGRPRCLTKLKQAGIFFPWS